MPDEHVVTDAVAILVTAAEGLSADGLHIGADDDRTDGALH
jgi:hypothetical protein